MAVGAAERVAGQAEVVRASRSLFAKGEVVVVTVTVAVAVAVAVSVDVVVTTGVVVVV